MSISLLKSVGANRVGEADSHQKGQTREERDLQH